MKIVKKDFYKKNPRGEIVDYLHNFSIIAFKYKHHKFGFGAIGKTIDRLLVFREEFTNTNHI